MQAILGSEDFAEALRARKESRPAKIHGAMRSTPGVRPV
jgi:hypothetical protein